jgi:hypothetical protein
LTLLIVLLVFINNHQISANSLSNKFDYQPISPIYNDLSYEDNDDSDSNILYIPDNEEITSRNPWSHLFHRYSDRSVGSPTYYSRPQSGFNLRRGEIHYIPYPFQKRAIPIEFQKALFAHGIVGRR